jgi:hypothetical protein
MDLLTEPEEPETLTMVSGFFFIAVGVQQFLSKPLPTFSESSDVWQIVRHSTGTWHFLHNKTIDVFVCDLCSVSLVCINIHLL